MTEQEAIKELEEMYEDGCYEEESLDAVDKEEALNMAKKALKNQEKNKTRREFYQLGYNDAKEKFQRRWIPVSERLPEVEQDVLLSLRSLEISTGFRANTDGYFYVDCISGKYVENENVIAWMPLPEPYKKEVEE